MSTRSDSRLDALKQPAYTGENRCIPCTLVNLVIAAVVSLGVYVAAAAPGVALVVFALFVVAIYFRGYLIPGTPTFTKRYFPDRVLAWFDKVPETTIDSDLDVEAQLASLGVVEPAADDVYLAPDFEREWWAKIEQVDADLPAHLADQFAVSDLEIHDEEDRLVVQNETVVAGQWPSRPALVADIAALSLLRERAANWEDLSLDAQSQLVSGLRIFLDSCPACGGDLSFSEDVVESCCRTMDVVTYDCDACGARLFEARV
ncbi:hypothetical protein ACFQH3_18820 [Haladaptatus sp. GCM10025707]|uniref:hypothetical protein n=1 Tax=unclassified Haladaptatus TaxID=2622732 RepID=UPI0023E76A60|nr:MULTISPECIES: hypothetical protein [unclassified Haladaptatus]